MYTNQLKILGAGRSLQTEYLQIIDATAIWRLKFVHPALRCNLNDAHYLKSSAF